MLSETGVTVEMSDNFQSFTLAVSCPNKRDPDYLQLFHAILNITKLACEEFCPCLEVIEMTTCPPEASSDHCYTVVELPLLKNALVAGKERVVDVKGNKYVVLSEWMKIEPCLPSLIGVGSEGETVYVCCAYGPVKMVITNSSNSIAHGPNSSRTNCMYVIFHCTCTCGNCTAAMAYELPCTQFHTCIPFPQMHCSNIIFEITDSQIVDSLLCSLFRMG